MKPIYYVEWIDSEASHEWTNDDEWGKAMLFKKIISIGFLIKETELGIALAVSWDEDNKHACSIHFIPHCCITKMQEIELK